MKITDLQVIPFRVRRQGYRAGSTYSEVEVVQTLTKIVTDEGAEGYYIGGHGHGDADGLPPDQRAALQGRFKNMLVGHDPFDREKFWHWLWVANVEENLLSVIDMALWDLQARYFGVPLYKLSRKGQGLCQHLPQHGAAGTLCPTCARLQKAGLHPLQDPPLLLLGPGYPKTRSGTPIAHQAGH